MSDSVSQNGQAANEAPSPAPDDAPLRRAAPPSAPASKRETLHALITSYVLQHLPDSSARPHSMDEPPRAVGTHARLIPYLRAVPWALSLLFLISFFWDFPGMSFTLWGYAFPLSGLLRITSVSGMIGFLTNWLAITMLFRPRAPRPIIGQGLVPAQRERIAFRLAQAVSDELISEEIVKQKIHESGLITEYRALTLSVARKVLEDPGFRRELKAVAAEYVEETLSSDEVRQRIVDFTEEQIEAHAGSGLPGLALRAYRFWNEEEFQARLHEAVRTLPHSIDPVLEEIDTVLDDLPKKLEARAADIEELLTRVVLSFVENLDIERIVVQNVRAYDERQLEALIKRTTNEQLNYIKYLGGVLGIFGGLVIWEPAVALTAFGLIGATLYALDEVLYRARQSPA